MTHWGEWFPRWTAVGFCCGIHTGAWLGSAERAPDESTVTAANQSWGSVSVVAGLFVPGNVAP